MRAVASRSRSPLPATLVAQPYQARGTFASHHRSRDVRDARARARHVEQLEPVSYGTLVRIGIALAATASLLAVLGPVTVHAQTATGAHQSPQTPSPRTAHVVRAGESLFSLALRYYGDGRMWRDLARLNGISETAARPLLVGMRLTVPSVKPRAASGVAAANTPDASTPKVATFAAQAPRTATATPDSARSPSRRTLAEQSAAKGDAARTKAGASVTKPTVRQASGDTAVPRTREPSRDSGVATASNVPLRRATVRVGLVDATAPRRAANGPEATVFAMRQADPAVAQQRMRDALTPPPPPARRGELLAAPFVFDRESVSGQVTRRIAVGAGTMPEADRALLADQVELTLPPGATAVVGGRFLTFADAGPVDSRQRRSHVASPGAELEIVRAEPGRAIVARVRSQFGIVGAGDRVIEAPSGAAAHMRLDTLASPDLSGNVVWVNGRSLQPTLQDYVLLSVKQGDQVKAGDHFALTADVGSANARVEERIAVVRIVRVDPTASTAIVVRQSRPGIRVGLHARRIARAP